jgi:hypothetical protein
MPSVIATSSSVTESTIRELRRLRSIAAWKRGKRLHAGGCILDDDSSWPSFAEASRQAALS